MHHINKCILLGFGFSYFYYNLLKESYLSYKSIWRVSWPVILSLLAQNVVSLTDTIFLGHVGEIELGASALASVYYMIFYMTGFGFATGIQILISRRNGGQKFTEIGAVFSNGVYFLLLLAVLFIVLSHYFTPVFFKYNLSSLLVYEAANEYMDVRIYGLFFSFMGLAFRSFYVGITNTKLIAASAFIMATVNVILNYGLIFGNLGLPEMGIRGAALASNIAEICSTLFFIMATVFYFDYKKYALFTSWKIQLQSIGKTLKISVFIMFQNLFSIGAWFIFFIIIEKSGERPLAVSNVIRSVYNIILLPVWAFSSTTNTFVSNAIGEGKMQLVIPIVKRVAYFAVVVVAVCSGISVFFQTEILSVFTTNQDLINDCRISFYIICVSSLSIAAGYTVFSGISGIGKTNIALCTEIMAIGFYLFSVYLFSRELQLQIEYAWLCEFAYGFSLLGLSVLYLKFGKWKNYQI